MTETKVRPIGEVIWAMRERGYEFLDGGFWRDRGGLAAIMDMPGYVLPGLNSVDDPAPDLYREMQSRWDEALDWFIDEHSKLDADQRELGSAVFEPLEGWRLNPGLRGARCVACGMESQALDPQGRIRHFVCQTLEG
ncbi:MAG: hypothetical protein ABR505_11895 [Actinomycetota bacterium]